MESDRKKWKLTTLNSAGGVGTVRSSALIITGSPVTISSASMSGEAVRSKGVRGLRLARL